MEKISIIIPVYGVEKYLAKCIESVISQTYTELEIILVDDGSPDESGKICDEYAEKDSRIRVIHKANGGVARARNDGIEAAAGDYISFMDSDDWISQDAYEKLYEALRKYNADCAIGGCVKVQDRDGVLEYASADYSGKEECELTEECIKKLLLNGSAVWNRLFKRKIFENVRFPLDRINDDEVAALHAYACCKKIVRIDAPTYFYRIRSNSITTSSFSLKKLDCYSNAIDNLDFINEHFPQLALHAEYKVEKSLLYCLVNLRRLKQTEETKHEIARLSADRKSWRRKALKNPYLPVMYKALFFI